VERFLLENMVIGISAGALSCLLGFAIARLITLLPLDVTGGGGTSSMIVMAAKLDPVEAIGSER
jgi:hypothetical protein